MLHPAVMHISVYVAMKTTVTYKPFSECLIKSYAYVLFVSVEVCNRIKKSLKTFPLHAFMTAAGNIVTELLLS